jgi:hypothetical protein
VGSLHPSALLIALKLFAIISVTTFDLQPLLNMSDSNFVAPLGAAQQPAIIIKNDATITGITRDGDTTDRMCGDLDTAEDNNSNTTEPSPYVLEAAAKAQDTGTSEDDTEAIEFKRETTDTADMRMVLYKGKRQTELVGPLGEQRLVGYEQAAHDTQTSPNKPYSLENLLRKVFVGHSKSLPTTQQTSYQ